MGRSDDSQGRKTRRSLTSISGHTPANDQVNLAAERAELFQSYCRLGGSPTSWREAEAKSEELDRREQELREAAGRARAVAAALPPALAKHANAAVAILGGSLVIAKALFEAHPSSPYVPENDRTLNQLEKQLRYEEVRLRGLEEALSPQALALARQASLTPHLEAIARHKTEMARKAEANRERHAQAMAEALVPTVERAARGDVVAWTQIAADAQANPAGFPEGFLDNWLAAAAEAAIEAGAAVVLERA